MVLLRRTFKRPIKAALGAAFIGQYYKKICEI
jgi:hypothetical protein